MEIKIAQQILDDKINYDNSKLKNIRDVVNFRLVLSDNLTVDWSLLIYLGLLLLWFHVRLNKEVCEEEK